MPGNEVGDRIHNFFGQENLSHGQHHAQVVDGTWPGGSSLWVGSQRQIGAPLISNLKNYNIQQTADSEKGQSSSVQHGVNLTQSISRSEFLRNQSQNHQPTLNGYIHGNQAFQTRQNEANFLGVDVESDRPSVTSRGISVLDSQLGNGPDLPKKNPMRLESTESPVNYDFFGSQQQMGSQHPGMLQPLPRQPAGLSEMQLLQQQVMLKQMQEFQRQQQLQKQQLSQQEARQLSSLNQVAPMVKQAIGNHLPGLINGIPVHDTSNLSWQSDLVAANTNWMQRVASPVMPGSSSGLMFSPEQGQTRLMGLVPQQFEQSLYGVPISSTRGTSNQYPSMQMDKPAMLQMSASTDSFAPNQPSTFLDQLSMQGNSLLSRQGSRGKNIFGTIAGGGSNGGLNLENMRPMNSQQQNASGQEFSVGQDAASLSETSQEKTSTQVTPSQNVATLDPTEERILFGSDDSLWDAFGRGTNMGSGSYNMLDGSDIFGASPSVQSGSWSALMQSAVAETSSDIGLQEEWSGLSIRNNEAASGSQQPSSVHDGGTQQSVWANYNLQTGSTLNSRPFPASGNTTTAVNYCNVLGTQQSGLKTSHEGSERLQTEPSQRLVQQFPDEGSKWLDQSPLQKSVAEGTQSQENVSHFSSTDFLKSISGSWNHQQSAFAFNSGVQPGMRPNGWNLVESVSPGGGATLKNHGNDRALPASQGCEHKNIVREGMGRGAGTWKADSFSNAAVEMEHAKSALGSPVLNREGRDLTASVTTRGNQESKQQFLNNHNLDFVKNSDSLINSRGIGVPGKYQHHLEKSPQNFESLGNNSLDKGVVETNEIETSIRENSGDSFRSNASQHTTASGHRENVWLDASDSRTLPGVKQVSSGPVGRKPSITRKFQYHPMGDLDVDEEPSYGTKHTAQSQALSQQVPQGDQAFAGQSKSVGHMARNSMDIDKGRFSGLQGDLKRMDEVPSKSMHPGHVPGTSASFDRSVGNYGPNKTAPLSQNMLELLHKVDQSREHGVATHFSSSERNRSSEIPEAETSDGSVGHLPQKQPSASQGFGLQLAPPSQRLSIPDHSSSSHGSSHGVNSFNSAHFNSDIRGMNHTWLAPTCSTQSLPPSHESSQGIFRNSVTSVSGQTSNNASQLNIQGNSSVAFTPGFSNSRKNLQNQHIIGSGGQMPTSQSVNPPFDRFASQLRQVDDSGTRAQSGQVEQLSLPEMSKHDHASSAETSQLNSSNPNQARDPAQRFPVLEAMPASQHSVTSVMSQQGVFPKVSPNTWANISNQRRPLVTQPCKAYPNLLKPHLQSSNNVETSLSDQQNPGQIFQKGGDGSGEIGVLLSDSQGLVEKEQPAKEQQLLPETTAGHSTVNTLRMQGKGAAVNCPSDTFLSSPTTTQRDIEAFGRSLRPNIVLNQNYSLLHQVQAMRNVEIDPSNRSMKRLKGPDNSADSQHVAARGQQLPYGSSALVRDTAADQKLAASGDPKMLSFSSKPWDDRDTNASAHDMLRYNQNDSQSLSSNNSPAAVRGDHSQISPQMAPSWFDQYGTFKNGHVLPMYDAQKIATAKTTEQPLNVGKPSDNLHSRCSMEQVTAADASQLRQISSPMTMASEPFSSPQLLLPETTDQSLAVVRPKKRKSATTDLLPWCKEVMQDSRRLHSISVAEAEWAQAVNHLPEKLEDETELSEDGSPVLKSKRRLILTMQLMQQVLHPPPAVVLSLDASSHYETVAYFVARAVAGDACCTLSSSKSDTLVLPEDGNLLSENLKASERIGYEYISKAMEDFIARAKKLESDLLRLDKRASILDLRVEWQDLEKFSVINRFAKFHGRGQADGAETSSSFDASANAQKSCLQRYVTALPMPRNLPDRVQCLSL